VVRVVVRVDEVGHLVRYGVRRGDLVDRPLQVVPDRRRRVEEDDAVRRGQEGGLVATVGDPVEVLLHLPDVVPVLVDGGADGGRWDRCVLR
jgi:hypothetical protein